MVGSENETGRRVSPVFPISILLLTIGALGVAFWAWHVGSSGRFEALSSAFLTAALVVATWGLTRATYNLAENSDEMRRLQSRIVEREAPILRSRRAQLEWRGRTPHLHIDLRNEGKAPCRVREVRIGYATVEVILDDEGRIRDHNVERHWKGRYSSESVKRVDDYTDLQLTPGNGSSFEVELDEGQIRWMQDKGEWLMVEVQATEDATVITGIQTD